MNVRRTTPTAVSDETRVRRRARQQGLKVLKARTHRRDDASFGTFMLVDPKVDAIVACADPLHGYGLTLEQIAEALERREQSLRPTTS